jgi:CheY-like chemotaxis protein
MASILFVDDDPDTLYTYNQAVIIFGHQALLANSGGAALNMACEHHPDLIFLDMRMPDMDGIELLSKLSTNEVTKDIPAIMVSASPETGLASKALKAGAKSYLSKPIRLNDLMKIIQQISDQ